MPAFSYSLQDYCDDGSAAQAFLPKHSLHCIIYAEGGVGCDALTPFSGGITKTEALVYFNMKSMFKNMIPADRIVMRSNAQPTVWPATPAAGGNMAIVNDDSGAVVNVAVVP
jgi:hypothetical protein